MGGVTSGPVERYLYALLPERDDVLARIEADAVQRGIPIVGPLAGTFLYLTARSIGARRVMECGCAVGYSAIWLARGILPFSGSLETCESDPERVREARENIRMAGLEGIVTVHEGDAREILGGCEREAYDLIFNDVDKQFYPEMLELIVPLLRPGGVLIADNVLWSGRVVNGRDGTTSSIREHNTRAFEHPSLESVIVPLRDGLLYAVKR